MAEFILPTEIWEHIFDNLTIEEIRRFFVVHSELKPRKIYWIKRFQWEVYEQLNLLLQPQVKPTLDGVYAYIEWS